MLLIDTSVVIIVVFTMLLGAYFGLFRQALALLGVLAATAAAGWFGPLIAGWLTSFFADEWLTQLIGFVLLLIVVSSLVGVLATLLRDQTGLLLQQRALDIAGGAVIGLLQGMVFVTALLAALATYPPPDVVDSLHQAVLPGLLMRGFGFVLQLMPEQFGVAARMLYLPLR